MTVVFGHDFAWKALIRHQYPVVLLTGPESVGKWTLAEAVIRYWGTERHNVLRIKVLTADGVRQLLHSAHLISDMGAKYVLIRLDGAAEDTLNMLLKFLEEPPPGVHVIMTSAEPVLPTIVSRAQSFVLGLLSEQDVASVLAQGGMAPEVARRQAPLGGGRVRPAREGIDQQARSQVIAVLRALAASDGRQLATALRDWGPEAHSLLQVWAGEAAVPRWRVFTADTMPQLTPQHARKVIGALARYPLVTGRADAEGDGRSPVRYRTAAHAALAPLCGSSA
jgi:hypothetical protein